MDITNGYGGDGPLSIANFKCIVYYINHRKIVHYELKSKGVILMNKPKKEYVYRQYKRKDISSLDIPWWIGGPKVIAAPSRRKEMK